MIRKPVVLVAACYGAFILTQSFVPKTMALKKTSNVDEYIVEDWSTHKRQNYMLQKTHDNELLRKSNEVGVSYEIEPFDVEANPEELSAFIVDYANMFKNDVILLDNSVETSKRGNMKLEKYNQAIKDIPCFCNYSKGIEDMGESAYPRFVETRKCNKVQQTCVPPYVCKESLYNLTILRKKEFSKRSRAENDDAPPTELRPRWTAESTPVSVGCICMRDYQN